MSDVSIVGSCLDSSIKMSSLYPKNTSSRRYYSHDDLYQPSSTQTTPQKLSSDRNKLNSLPNTPSINKKNNVRFSSPNHKDNPEVLHEIDTFISNVKTIQRNHAVRSLQHDFTKQSQEDKLNKVKSWKCNEDVDTIPGIRDLGNKQQNEIPVKRSFFKANFQTSDCDSNDSSSESTQLTALKKMEDFDRFETKLNGNEDHLFKKLMDNANNVEGRAPKKRGINTLTDNYSLLSLADIWGSGQLSPSKMSQKIQEERLRRQHCEQLIHELQSKNLEMQEKLSVAVKVDDSKNKALQEFKDSLDAVSLHMEKLIEEKSMWERELVRQKNQHSIEIESANQKVNYYEKEASKSLSLARGNQDKISDLETRCSDLQSKLSEIEIKFKEVDENYEVEFGRNKQLVEIISQKEIELKEKRNVLNNARDEVAHSRKAVEVCQAEFTVLKEECNRLQSELKTEKSKVSNLNEQKKKLLTDLEACKQTEKSLKDNLEQSKQKLENTKLELRNFYQGQLEIIVENKRKEMQTQLDQERQNSQEEIKRKELSMAKAAANHIKEVSEKCVLETKLLDQKHQEEIRLYQMQLTQSHKEIEILRSKLAHLPEKRAQIAKQIQKVMENQWNEALKMIDDTPTPERSEHGYACKKEEIYKREPESVSDLDETPVSSRGGQQKQSDSEIQKYINMLLNRPPGNPLPETQDQKPSQTQQRSSWHPSDLESPNRMSEWRQCSAKDRKPPWK
ncbi:unnamed protein product [Ceutorhynchus assimilis]|uniref:Centrobin n=1 Tax=Ceutorhynchus assimilis TaxID=467358 RepID=A0A9P0GQK6_9CUCU|nr:unnamed protein product [Ceutorhynchus assimilis]